MSQFEYIAIPILVIAGLSIAHLRDGTAALIAPDMRSRRYWIHLLWGVPTIRSPVAAQVPNPVNHGI